MKTLFVAILSSLVSTNLLAGSGQRVAIEITEKGFTPSSVDVKPGTNVTLDITRKTETTCATEIQIPSKKIKQALPLNKTVSIDIGKVEKGEIRFGCGMNLMESGQIIVR